MDVLLLVLPLKCRREWGATVSPVEVVCMNGQSLHGSSSREGGSDALAARQRPVWDRDAVEEGAMDEAMSDG